MEAEAEAQEVMNEYERRRLQNIRRNDEMIAALRLHAKAASLLFKRPSHRLIHGIRVMTTKSEKKLDTAVIRRSLRTRGISPPHSEGREKANPLPAVTTPKSPVPMSDAYRGHRSDRSFIASFVAIANEESPHLVAGEVDGGAKDGVFEVKERGDKVTASFEVGSMGLDPKNIVRFVPEKINALRFIPSSTVKMIVVGTHLGNIGLWDVEDEERRVYLYHPHPASINGVLVHPHCLSQIYTSCHDGTIWLMDVEKETFVLEYSSNDNEHIFCLQQPKDEVNSLYFGQGRGGLTVWDKRMGKCSSQWVLHRGRINTIDFNPENPHIVATSSSDRNVCTWDLRYADVDNITALRTLTHNSGVQSAYFSPSGCSLATTSLDNIIGIYGGVNLENETTIYDNQSRDCLSTFRATWGWDDSCLFGGNTKRGVDVVSTVERKIVKTLKSPHVSAIMFRFDAHPYEVGTLATAAYGQVYIWTSHSS